MPQRAVNSTNVQDFKFDVRFDLYNRQVIFDISNTVFQGGGGNATQGVAFSLEDEGGVVLAEIDFTAPQIPNPGTVTSYTLDLSASAFVFLFQNFKIVGAVKDANVVYETVAVYKKVCQPVAFNNSGYVPGIFQITPNCADNQLTIKELTVFTYNGSLPSSTTKDGTLYYPTGTISPVSFTDTPFSNDPVYSGQYRIACDSVAEYDLGDGVYVDVTYVTDNAFDVTCSSKMSDLLCCIVGLQDTWRRNCETAIGKNARAQLDEVTIPLFVGLTKEINGQDASAEADLIKKTLRCDCGASSVRQNEISPVNPSVYSIVITGVGGTSTDSSISGNTKTFTITSKIYQVVKGEVGDDSFSITTDNSVPNTVKYVITLDGEALADKILGSILADSTLLAQLNSMVEAVGVNITGLDGKCVIDLAHVDYSLQLAGITSSTLITSVVIDGVTYNAPANTHANSTAAVNAWLNSLSKGAFSSVFGSGILTIISTANTHVLATATFTTPNTTVAWVGTNKTLVQVLQAIIDAICALSDLGVSLSSALTLMLFDYNGVPVTVNFPEEVSQAQFNLGLSQAINNIVATIYALTGVTCAKVKSIFVDQPNIVFGTDSRIYGKDDSGACTAWNSKQIAELVIAAINSYADTKAAYCAIDCSEPALCPEVGGFSMAMAGSNIGIYGVTWATTPNATQIVSVRYKLSSSPTWITATNALQVLANGNINGITPFLITGVTGGQTYDVNVINNCGGVGFVSQITVPTAGIYSGDFLLDSSIYTICAQSPITLYSSSPFAPGVTMYSNPGLTVPVTGNNYIAGSTDGVIYNINTVTGIVGASTGSSCNTGTVGKYILSNSTIGICSSAFTIRYTNGAFAVGKTLYVDSALTTPQTGYAYAYHVGTNRIYNLNSSTGVIGADTGAGCTFFSSTFRRGNDLGTVCGAGTLTLYSSSPFVGVGVTLYTNSALTTPLTGYAYVVYTATGEQYLVNTTTGEVVADVGNCGM